VSSGGDAIIFNMSPNDSVARSIGWSNSRGEAPHQLLSNPKRKGGSHARHRCDARPKTSPPPAFLRLRRSTRNLLALLRDDIAIMHTVKLDYVTIAKQLRIPQQWARRES
jgi:hypothetical protein